MVLATTPVGLWQLPSPVRLAALLLVGCSLCVGCGEAGPPRGRVAGKVTLNGEPLAAGQVHLYSKARGSGGRATLDAAGSFKMATPLVAGDDTALVTPPPPTVAPGVAPRKTADSSSPSPAAQTANIPLKYLSETTSDLKVTVESDKEVVVKLELHGDVQPPPVTPAEPSTDVAETTHAESAPAEPPEPSPESVKAPASVAARPVESTGGTSASAPPAAAVASGGASGQTWLLAAAGGGAFVLVAMAAGAFIFLRSRNAPVRAAFKPVAPRPISAPVGHGQSAAFPRLAKSAGAAKPPDVPVTTPTTPPAESPAPKAEHPPMAATPATPAPAAPTAAAVAAATATPVVAGVVAGVVARVDAPVIAPVIVPVIAPAAAPVAVAATAPITVATVPAATTTPAGAPVAPPVTATVDGPVTAPNQTADAPVPATAPLARCEALSPTAKELPAQDPVAAASPVPVTKPEAPSPLEERAAERSIAEWVLARGGRLRVHSDAGASVNISQVSEIPAKTIFG